MYQLSAPQYQEMSKALSRVGAAQQCPICQHAGFDIHPSYAYQTVGIDERSRDQQPLRFAVTCAVTVCQHCGFLALHSLQKLGLIAAEEDV